MSWRRWHRWAAIPAGIFLFFIALTGVLLHADMIRLGQHPPGHEPGLKREVQSLPTDTVLATMIGRLADRVRASGTPVTELKVNLAGPRITLTAGAGGPPGAPELKLDALTGAQIVAPPPPADFHYILQDFHAGYYFGWTGRLISILSGLALIILSISGLQLWWDMRRRGKKGIYWK